MYQGFTKRKKLPTGTAQWHQRPFKKNEDKSEWMSKFYCFATITMLIVSFASCEKDDDRDSLVGITLASSLLAAVDCFGTDQMEQPFPSLKNKHI